MYMCVRVPRNHTPCRMTSLLRESLVVRVFEPCRSVGGTSAAPSKARRAEPLGPGPSHAPVETSTNAHDSNQVSRVLFHGCPPMSLCFRAGVSDHRDVLPQPCMHVWVCDCASVNTFWCLHAYVHVSFFVVPPLVWNLLCSCSKEALCSSSAPFRSCPPHCVTRSGTTWHLAW